MVKLSFQQPFVELKTGLQLDRETISASKTSHSNKMTLSPNTQK